jgi:U3 small nucleolar ribonucleoprotein protein LCP5
MEMTKKKGFSSVAEPEVENPTVDALKETLKKVEASLIPAVDSFCSNGSKSNGKAALPSSFGLDFLHVKNTLLLSYLIDLLVHIRDTVEPLPSHPEADSDEESKEEESDSEDKQQQQLKQQQQQQQQKRRLLEMRTVLDKSRGLDKKLRYQIDKLLSSLTDSSAFATGGEGTNNSNDSGDEGDREGFTNDREDPLRYRPDPKAMLDNSDDDDSAEEDDNSDDGGDEDEDLASARATLAISKKNKSKKYEDDGQDDDEDDRASKKYIAPRLTAVPYTHDVADKRVEQEKRQRRKLRASELAQTLRQQYGDQPDTEDVFGGGNSELYGKQRSASKALAQREAERIEFEESTMVRLTTSRKEKKEKKRVERMLEGGSNLAQIANLGNLVRETEAFGRNDNHDGSDDEYGEREKALETYMSGEQNNNEGGGDGNSSRHANGKRRRGGPITDDSGRETTKMGKRPKAYNSYQAELYGGGKSNSGSKASKGKKNSRR